MKRIIQFNIEDPYGLYIEKLKPEDIVEFAKSINVNTIVIFARDGWGRTFYKSEYYPKHPKVSDDFLAQLYKKCKENGIDLINMVCHTSNKYLFQKHPDYVQRNAKGEIIALDSVREEKIHWPLMCLNSGFIDYCLHEIDEVRALSDGIMLDSFRYQPDFELACVCDNCKKSFKKHYGKELPMKEDWNDPNWWISWFWRYKVVIDKIKKIKAKAKDKILIYNSHPAGWGWRANYIVEHARDWIDVIFAESSEVDFQPLGFLIEIVKLSRGLSGKEVWATRNAFHIFNTPYLANKETLELGVWEIISAGGMPMFLVFLSTYWENKSRLSILGEIYKKVERVEELLDKAKPVEDIAIVYSNFSRDFFGKKNADLYNDEVRGFFYALLNMHYQVGFIGERDLSKTNLGEKYKAIILPNKIVMSKEEVANIRNQLRKNERLRVLATYLTSTYLLDKEDYPVFYEVGDFLLSNEFGAHYYGVSNSRWIYYKSLRYGSGLIGSYDETSGNVAVIEPIEERFVIGEVMSGKFPTGYEYTLGRSPPPRGNKISYMTCNRIAYLPFQLGKALFTFGYNEYYDTLKRLLDIKDDVEIIAPETLRAIRWEREDAILFHLINETTNHRIMTTTPISTKFTIGATRSINIVREIIPVKNIKLVLHDELADSVREVKLAFNDKNTSIKIEKRENEKIIEISRVDLYNLLIIEK